MFTANDLDKNPDAGFLRAFDAQSARRQFQVSVALILVVDLAAFAVGALARLDQSIAPASPPLAKMRGAHTAETALDIRS
jgi:hypothetical protein